MQQLGNTPDPQKKSQRLNVSNWNDVTSPGCYLFIGSGDLARVTADAVQLGHSPLITFTSNGSSQVAKLADDPTTVISKLRQIAADSDYAVNF
jgi:hypothetical protein